MLIRLGGDPAVRVRQSNPFYGKPERLDSSSVHKILSKTLEGEQMSAVGYRKLARAMECDPAAAALLERIADDEEHHARMLSRALDGFSAK
jgi:rubrerythrin